MRLTVILSTYNAPRRLGLVLTGYEEQKFDGFDIVVADDGSTDATGELIEEHRSRGRLSLSHVWHPDEGFRKCAILNRAIEAATGEYLVISDGDCIPRPDFLGVHARLARQGRFLSGGRCQLTRELSDSLETDDVASGRVFDPAWLARCRGLARPRDGMKLRSPSLSILLDRITPTRATWNGHNASGWRRDIVEVNGFDERLGYGGEDRELGERLSNHGVQAFQIRHRAVCFHLDHDRGYVDPAVVKRNDEIRRAVTSGSRPHWTEHGIVKAGTEATPETAMEGPAGL
ncbi:MAG: glycosyltransferase family 2 protein [Gemmatimonadota bacterium]|nr:glycosyltransferase family 2 protein [Gemmatimonadota bacterium]